MHAHGEFMHARGRWLALGALGLVAATACASEDGTTEERDGGTPMDDGSTAMPDPDEGDAGGGAGDGSDGAAPDGGSDGGTDASDGDPDGGEDDPLACDAPGCRFELREDCPAQGPCVLDLPPAPDGHWYACEDVPLTDSLDPDSFDFESACAGRSAEPVRTDHDGIGYYPWCETVGVGLIDTERELAGGCEAERSAVGFAAMEEVNASIVRVQGVRYYYYLDDCSGTCSPRYLVDVFVPGDTADAPEACADDAASWPSSVCQHEGEPVHGVKLPFGPASVGSLAPEQAGSTWLRCQSDADVGEDAADAELAAACADELAAWPPEGDEELAVLRFDDSARYDELQHGTGGWRAVDCAQPVGEVEGALRFFTCPNDLNGGLVAATEVERWDMREIEGRRYWIDQTDPSAWSVAAEITDEADVSPDPCQGVEPPACLIE